MQGNWYRIKAPTLGVIARDDQRELIIIPAGALVEVPDDTSDSLLTVAWQGESVSIRGDQLRENAEKAAGPN